MRLTRVLRLTLLAPDIVEAILDGKQGPDMTLARLMEPYPSLWPRLPRLIEEEPTLAPYTATYS